MRRHTGIKPIGKGTNYIDAEMRKYAKKTAKCPDCSHYIPYNSKTTSVTVHCDMRQNHRDYINHKWNITKGHECAFYKTKCLSD